MSYADIVLPNLGFGMEEGRLLNWLKQPGDPVRKGESVAEIESDKANVELEAVVDGVLDAILVPAEQVVAVGTVLARIRTGEAADDNPDPPVHSLRQAQSGTSLSLMERGDKVPDAVVDRGQRVSPLAQRLAQEHGVDLAAVQGTGPNGRITQEDVQAVINRAAGNGHAAKVLTVPAVRKLARDNHIDLGAIVGTGKEGRIRREDVEAVIAKPSPPTPLPQVEGSKTSVGEVVQPTEGRREVTLSPMRRTIAQRLTQSMQEAPHFYTTAELDFTDAIAALPPGVGVNALILYLCVKTLQAQPDMNATYENGHLYHYDHVHLAIAVALPNGLMSPVLKRADDYSLSGLADRSRDLIERTRAGKLKPDEVAGGTFTISNLGVVKQIDRFTALINPPQVGILAVGAAKPRPVVLNGGLHMRTTAHLTLSADHRVVDGMVAACFLEAFDQQLQGFNTN